MCTAEDLSGGVRGPLERDRETRTWPDWLAGWVRNAPAPLTGPQGPGLRLFGPFPALPQSHPTPCSLRTGHSLALPRPATLISAVSRAVSSSRSISRLLCPDSLFSTSLQSTTLCPRTFPALLGYIEQAPYPFILRRSLKSTAEDPGSYNRHMGTAKTEEEDAMEPLWS